MMTRKLLNYTPNKINILHHISYLNISYLQILHIILFVTNVSVNSCFVLL